MLKVNAQPSIDEFDLDALVVKVVAETNPDGIETTVGFLRFLTPERRQAFRSGVLGLVSQFANEALGNVNAVRGQLDSVSDQTEALITAINHGKQTPKTVVVNNPGVQTRLPGSRKLSTRKAGTPRSESLSAKILRFIASRGAQGVNSYEVYEWAIGQKLYPGANQIKERGCVSAVLNSLKRRGFVSTRKIKGVLAPKWIAIANPSSREGSGSDQAADTEVDPQWQEPSDDAVPKESVQRRQTEVMPKPLTENLSEGHKAILLLIADRIHQSHRKDSDVLPPDYQQLLAWTKTSPHFGGNQAHVAIQYLENEGYMERRMFKRVKNVWCLTGKGNDAVKELADGESSEGDDDPSARKFSGKSPPRTGFQSCRPFNDDDWLIITMGLLHDNHWTLTFEGLLAIARIQAPKHGFDLSSESSNCIRNHMARAIETSTKDKVISLTGPLDVIQPVRRIVRDKSRSESSFPFSGKILSSPFHRRLKTEERLQFQKEWRQAVYEAICDLFEPLEIDLIWEVFEDLGTDNWRATGLSPQIIKRAVDQALSELIEEGKVTVIEGFIQKIG